MREAGICCGIYLYLEITALSKYRIIIYYAIIMFQNGWYPKLLNYALEVHYGLFYFLLSARRSGSHINIAL